MYQTKEDFKKSMKQKKENKENGIGRFFFILLIKCLIVVIIFLASLIYVKKNESNKENFKNIVYKNSLSFAKIYSVYKDYLGDVIPFKNVFKDDTKLVSNEKLSYEKIEKENNGYVLTVSDDYALSAIKGGIITEVKHDDKYLNIIKIQDKSGLNITYGYIDELNVKLYDYVDKGELIGKCKGKLYLIFEKDNKFISYEEYL